MNEMTQPGLCADYEHDIVELIDGALAPEKALVIRSHLDACPRCRAWHAEFVALDADLADVLPRPALSADFSERLRDRLGSMTPHVDQGALRAAADAEYRRLVESIERGTWRSALLNACAAAIVTACGLLLARSLLPYATALLPAIGESQRVTALGILGAACALGALAWSATRGALPMFRLRA